jgi:hypothetical protein
MAPTKDTVEVTASQQRRAELALEAEHLDLLDAFTAAKSKDDEHSTPATRKARADARRAFGEHRRFWRQVGEAVGTRTAGATSADNEGEG